MCGRGGSGWWEKVEGRWVYKGGSGGGRGEWRGRLTTQWLNPGVRTSIPTIDERRWSDTKMAPLLSLSGSARKIAPCRVVQNIILVSAYSSDPCLSDKSEMHEVSLPNKDLEECMSFYS